MAPEIARAWIAGYGSKLVPRAPFEVARLGDSDRVVFAHHADGAVPQVMVAPGASADDTRIALGPGTASLGEAIDFVEEDERGGFDPSWRVSTPDFEHAWPRGWTLWSTPWDAAWPFELTPGGDAVPRDALIHVQGPWPAAAAPTLDSLVAPDMSRVDHGAVDTPHGACRFIDLHYMHDTVRWAQRRALAPLDAGHLVLLTAQTPTVATPLVWQACTQIATTLRRR